MTSPRQERGCSAPADSISTITPNNCSTAAVCFHLPGTELSKRSTSNILFHLHQPWGVRRFHCCHGYRGCGSERLRSPPQVKQPGTTWDMHAGLAAFRVGWLNYKLDSGHWHWARTTSFQATNRHTRSKREFSLSVYICKKAVSPPI